MRILLLAPHPFFTQRGTPIAERMLLEVLAAQGHEIDVLTFPEGEDPRIPNVRIHRVPAPAWTHGMRPGFSLKKLAGDAAMLGSCLRRIRRRRYDLVHAVEESAFIALLCKWLFGVPYIYDMDSGLVQQMVDRFPGLARVRGLLDAFERLAVRGSSGTLAVCGSLEAQARAVHPRGIVACLEDVSLLGPGNGSGGAGLYPEDWRGDPIVLYVGNLEAYQGISLLLAGFARALAQVPRARLVVVGGEDAEISRYQGEAEKLGIAGSVHFAGARPVEGLADCLRQATLLVSPRVQGTNTPMKIYSYLDSGRPLLATRLPTHTQVLDDDVAFLAEPEPGDLGRGIAHLLRDEVLRERLAGNARRLAQREFTPEAFRRKLLAFYDTITERIAEHDDDGETAGLEARRPGRG